MTGHVQTDGIIYTWENTDWYTNRKDDTGSKKFLIGLEQDRQKARLL